MERPLVIVAGGDVLASSIADRLATSGACDVRIYWNDDPADSARLIAAGATNAAVIMAVDQDDQTNLEIAVQARRINPTVRIVLRQFKRAIAKKIESNLENCSVISLSTHAAATYAAAAMDPSAFLGVQFPQDEGDLYAFSRRRAKECGVAAMRVADAERSIRATILAVGSRPASPDDVIGEEDTFVAFGPVEHFSNMTRHSPWLQLTHGTFEGLRILSSEIDPLIRSLFIVGFIVFVVATLFFSHALQKDLMTAAYFVVTTMTTTGYGDISLATNGPYIQFAGIVLMILSVAILNLTFAFFAAAVVRAQLGMVQGIRPIREHGHIVVVGCGRLGSRVVDLLIRSRALVVVVDIVANEYALRMARARKVKFFAGDGRQDVTLDACAIDTAHSVVASTDDDTHNLELALGARARQANIPVIVRVTSDRFAESVAQAFNIRRIFSPLALAAPTFCDLAFRPQARARLEIGDTSHIIEEAPADRALLINERLLVRVGESALIMTLQPSPQLAMV
jgi:Trk K+ transport system NAD-binding subunit